MKFDVCFYFNGLVGIKQLGLSWSSSFLICYQNEKRKSVAFGGV